MGSRQVLAAVNLELAESCDGGRYHFDGPIVLNRGGAALGYNVRVIPRNDLPASVTQPAGVAVAGCAHSVVDRLERGRATTVAQE